MKKGNKVILIMSVCVILLCVVAIFMMQKFAPSGTIATISVYGKETQKINLTQVHEPKVITVENGRGGVNKIRVENGKIAIIEANCPDHLCVEKGYTSSSLLPVVCLPNGVLIEITEDAHTTPLELEIDTLAE
ncbi:MAG: NusG domain II-containing protein [Cellulosilyticaceae bacterium]